MIISKDNFEGKGRNNNQNNTGTETKQNEKKRKGFEKNPWWQFPRTKDHFRSKGKKHENAKGRKNRNDKIMKKNNGDKKGMIIFSIQKNDENETMKK